MRFKDSQSTVDSCHVFARLRVHGQLFRFVVTCSAMNQHLFSQISNWVRAAFCHKHSTHLAWHRRFPSKLRCLLRHPSYATSLWPLWRWRKSQTLWNLKALRAFQFQRISTYFNYMWHVWCPVLLRKLHGQVVKDDGIWKVTEWSECLALGLACHSDGATPQFSLLASARPESHSVLIRFWSFRVLPFSLRYFENFWDLNCLNFGLLSCPIDGLLVSSRFYSHRYVTEGLCPRHCSHKGLPLSALRLHSKKNSDLVIRNYCTLVGILSESFWYFLMY